MDITPLSLSDVEIHLTLDLETREDWVATAWVRGEPYQSGMASTQLFAVIELARMLAWESTAVEERESEEPVT